MFDFDELDAIEPEVATGTVRTLIDTWNKSLISQDASGAEPLVYDSNGVDQFGAQRPTHWNVILEGLTESTDYSKDGRRIHRLEGDPAVNLAKREREQLESTISGTEQSINESEEGSSHLTDEAGPKLVDVDVIGDEVPSQKRWRRPIKPARKIGSVRLKLVRGMTVDSGAADNVMPRRMVRGKFNRIRPSAGSKTGVHYRAANNGRIKNEGECEFKFSTSDGKDHSYTFQIAEVNKALCSVSYLVDNGHRAVYDQDDEGNDISVITHKKSGEEIRMVRSRNVWTIETFVDEDDDEIGNEGDFGRQGR